MANLYRRAARALKTFKETARTNLKPILSNGLDLDILQKELLIESKSRLQNIEDCKKVKLMQRAGLACSNCEHRVKGSICSLHNKVISPANICIKHITTKAKKDKR